MKKAIVAVIMAMMLAATAQADDLIGDPIPGLIVNTMQFPNGSATTYSYESGSYYSFLTTTEIQIDTDTVVNLDSYFYSDQGEKHEGTSYLRRVRVTRDACDEEFFQLFDPDRSSCHNVSTWVTTCEIHVQDGVKTEYGQCQ